MAEEALTAGQVFARRLREVRKRRDWTQEKLAERLRELGFPMHRVTLAKIEKGEKRALHVELEEVLAISFALGVSPLHMIVPFDPEAQVKVVEKRQAVWPEWMRSWLRGKQPLLDEDAGFFLSEIPAEELEDVMRQALEVKWGRRANPQAIEMRRRMIEEGTAPSIESDEEALRGLHQQIDRIKEGHNEEER